MSLWLTPTVLIVFYMTEACIEAYSRSPLEHVLCVCYRIATTVLIIHTCLVDIPLVTTLWFVLSADVATSSDSTHRIGRSIQCRGLSYVTGSWYTWSDRGKCRIQLSVKVLIVYLHY